MDRRLGLELLPGIAFLVGNAAGDLAWAAGAAVIATVLAVALRWRWDGRVPWLAVATLVLALVLTGASLALRDATFVLLRPTIGALAFAAILAIGALPDPTLLERSLGYSIRMRAPGWRVLHAGWIALALLSAEANEGARERRVGDLQRAVRSRSDRAAMAGNSHGGRAVLARGRWVATDRLMRDSGPRSSKANRDLAPPRTVRTLPTCARR